MTRFRKLKLPDPMNPNVHPMVTAIYYEINRQKVPLAELVMLTGISYTTIDRWRSGASSPTLKQIDEISKRLDCELRLHRLYTREVEG